MTLITTPEFRRKRNLATLHAVRDDLAKLGLTYTWDKSEEDATKGCDFAPEDQATLRKGLPDYGN